MKMKRYLALMLSAIMIMSSPLTVLANETDTESVVISEFEEITEDVIVDEVEMLNADECMDNNPADSAAESFDCFENTMSKESESVSISADVVKNSSDDNITETDEELADSTAKIESVETAASVGYVLSDEQQRIKASLSKDINAYENIREGEDCVAGQVITLADSMDEAEIIAEIYNAKIHAYDYGVVVLELPKDRTVPSTVALSAEPDIKLPPVAPNFISKALSSPITNFDPFTLSPAGKAYQYHHDVIGSKAAWKHGYTGEGVTVAVLDAGINKNHIELVGREAAVAPFTLSTPPTNYTPNVDYSGHGTHVASTIVGNINAKGGMGVAPMAKYINVKVLNDAGKANDAEIIMGINYAASVNADIINMSLGEIYPNPVYAEAIHKAYVKGIAVFASAGNDGGKAKNFPATYEHVISVAATEEINDLSDYSNRGSYIDIAAPGSNIVSAYCNKVVLEKSPNPNETFNILSGTSMACPVASGEAALILSSGSLGSKSAERVDDLEKLMKESVKIKVKGIEKKSGIVDLPTALNIEDTVVENTVSTASGITAIGDENAITKVKFVDRNPTIFSNVSLFSTATITNKVDLKTEITGTGAYIVECNKPKLAKVSLVQQGVNPIIRVEATGAGTGSVKITLMSENKKKKASTSVKIVDPITHINIASGPNRSNYLAQGSSLALKKTINSEFGKKISNKKLTWSIQSATYDGSSYPTTGLTVTNGGKLKLDKYATAGVQYVIKAESNDGSGACGYYTVTSVANPTNKKVLFIGSENVPAKLFKMTKENPGAVAALGDFSSRPCVDVSNPKIAAANIDFYEGRYYVYLYGFERGNVKVSVKTSDGTNVKGSFSIKVF